MGVWKRQTTRRYVSVGMGAMREFVEELSRGGANFFDGWMQNPKSALISCNDGFRPMSFYIQTIE